MILYSDIILGLLWKMATSFRNQYSSQTGVQQSIKLVFKHGGWNKYFCLQINVCNISLQILLLFGNTSICVDKSCAVYQNGWIPKTTVGFPYHLNGHKKKITDQIVDIIDNVLLDELYLYCVRVWINKTTNT